MQSETTAPLITPHALREAEAEPPVPFAIALAPGKTLRVVRLLRTLPGRRYVGEAWLHGTHVLAKLFVSSSSQRHCTREVAGITALSQAGIATPILIAHGELPDGGHYLLTRFMPEAVPFSGAWAYFADRPPENPDAIAMLQPLFSLLGRLHRVGLIHQDLHTGNFLVDGPQTLLIDGDAVNGTVGKPLDVEQTKRNLGMLMAQFPIHMEDALPALLSAYHAENPEQLITPSSLQPAIDKARQARWRDYQRKLGRNCTLFVSDKTWQRFTVVQRSHRQQLSTVLQAPDDWIAGGEPLKLGRSATVARIQAAGQRWVIKRYNIKHIGHAISRALRPTRAWHAWVEGHRLGRLGIATPTPCAVIETRLGPLRGRSWLICNDLPGQALSQLLDATGQLPPDEPVGRAILTLFRALSRARVTHGDLKATNLVWHDARLYLIDLDATTWHANPRSFAKAWRKDRARLLRNWPEGSTLHAWLAENLPPA